MRIDEAQTLEAHDAKAKRRVLYTQNGLNVQDKSIDQVASVIIGPPGQPVSIRFLRRAQNPADCCEFTVELLRTLPDGESAVETSLLAAQVKELESKLVVSESALNKALAELQTCRQQVLEAQEAHSTAVRNLAQSQKESVSLKSDIFSLQKELEEASHSSEHELQRLSQSLKDKGKMESLLQEQIEGLTGRLSEMQKQIEQERQASGRALLQAEKSVTTSDALQAELERLKLQVVQLQEKLVISMGEVGTLDRRLASAHKQIADYTSEITFARKEHRDVARQLGTALRCLQNLMTAVIQDESTNLGGVGVKIEGSQSHGDLGAFVRVDEILPGGSAHSHGKIKVEDIITEVDGRDVTGLSIEEVRELILGPSGTPVTISGIHGDTNIRYMVTLVRSSGVSSEMGKLEHRTKTACQEIRKFHKEAEELSLENRALKEELELLKQLLAKERLENASRITQLSSARRDTESELMASKHALAETTLQYSASETELQRLRARCQEADKSLISKASEISSLETKCSDLAAKLSKQRTELDRTVLERNQLTEEVQNLKDAMNMSVTKMSDTEAEIAKGLRHAKSLEDAAAQQMEKIRDLGAQLLGTQEEASKLRGEVDKERKVCTQLRNQAEATERDLAQERERASMLAKDLALARGEVGRLKTEIDRMKGELSDREVQVEQGAGEGRKVKRELDGAKRELERLSAELQRLSGELVDTITESKKSKGELDASKKEAAGLKSELQRVRDDFDYAVSEGKKYKGELEGARKEIARLSAELQRVSGELVDTITESKKLKGELDMSKKEAAMLKSEMRRMTGELEVAVAEAKKLKIETECEKEAKSSLREANVRLESELVAERGRLAELSQSLASSKTECSNLKVEVTKLLNDLGDMKQRHLESLNTIHGKDSNVAMLQSQISGLENDLHTCKAEILTAHEEHGHLAADLAITLNCLQSIHQSVTRKSAGSEAGIGVKIEGSNNHGETGSFIRIDDIMQGGSAYGRGKLHIDDVIVAVNGRDLTGLSVGEVRNLIVGPIGTPVTLTGLQEGSGNKYMVTLIRSGGDVTSEVLLKDMARETCTVSLPLRICLCCSVHAFYFERDSCAELHFICQMFSSQVNLLTEK